MPYPLSYTKEQLAVAIAESYSWADVMRKLRKGAKPYAANKRRSAKKYAALWGISTEHFPKDMSSLIRKLYSVGKMTKVSYIPIENMLTTNSNHDRGTIKRKLLRENKIPNICNMCGVGPEWMGKKMSLVLDHINGINNDSRIENLRLLCPNCNATLDTHCGKNTAKHKAKQIAP